MTKSRHFDLTIFGATGFTGQLTAEYLAQHPDAGNFRWAIAGRSHQKLEQVHKELVALNPACKEVGIIQANSDDLTGLREMAAQTKAIVSTVGPYAEYGDKLVEACVAEGTHYADLTGEPEFVDRCLLERDEQAREKQVKIVNCCGFDSIPHDLGAMFTVDELLKGLKKSERELASVRIEGFVIAGGMLSGGTWHSAVKGFGKPRRMLQQRRRLNQKRKSENMSDRSIHGIKPRVRYRSELGRWACPFPTIDGDVVKRSAWALPGYGQSFDYGHYVQVKRLPKLVGGVAGVAGIFALSQLPPTRKALLAIRKPGEGPSVQQRNKGWFSVTFLGSAQVGGKPARSIRTEVTGGDPGYGETAKMLAESGLCLALDGSKAPRQYGVVTPAAGLGKALLKRLQAAGIGFDVVQRAP